ncbi:MAG: alpha/beta hydrolase [Lachnospiraceae bacterium]|jgi:alpha-beta hydrolase superfamily lysophospholipase|nr:alpha/beta hydrolase [Lachnospiraceae bacterium]
MEKKEFTIESRDGLKTPVHCVEYIPDTAPVCVLIVVHGMAEYIGRYAPFMEYLCGQGFVVAGEDMLGHGQTAATPGDRGYFCETDPATVIVRDVHRLKKTVQAQYPGVPVFILGHSMGSFLVRNYICRYGTGVNGAIIMGTGMNPPSTLKFAQGLASMQARMFGGRHPAKMLDKIAFSSYNKRIPEAKTKFDWLSVDPDNVSRYIADPLCGFLFSVNGFQTMFELMARLYEPGYLGKMPKDLPVLFVSGAEDPVGDYGRSVEAVYRSFCDTQHMTDVSMKLFPGDRHEILNDLHRREVYEYLQQWVLSKIKGKE